MSIIISHQVTVQVSDVPRTLASVNVGQYFTITAPAWITRNVEGVYLRVPDSGYFNFSFVNLKYGFLHEILYTSPILQYSVKIIEAGAEIIIKVQK